MQEEGTRPRLTRVPHLRTQEEMAHTCRGTINLAGAVIDTVDSTHFVITNGPTQVFHLRALNEVERQRWVTALELAKGTAIRRLDGKFLWNEGGGLCFTGVYPFGGKLKCRSSFSPSSPSSSPQTIVTAMKKPRRTLVKQPLFPK